MRAALLTKPSSTAPPIFTPVPRGLLQRKCACGGRPGSIGECESCREKKLQRRSENLDRSSISCPPSSVSEVPSVVHEVLRSPGQPLDQETRVFMEPRFGHDFSGVRVHTDASAAESAGAVNALAYTVGSDIVFGSKQYRPAMGEGRQLVAHELTHVLQQTVASGAPISSAQGEHEAEQNSRRLVADNPGSTISHVQAGQIQRQEKGKEKKKPEAEITAETTVTEKLESKFGFDAEVTVPLTEKLSFGSLAFLDELKIKGEGGVLNIPPAASGTKLEDPKLQLAIKLANFELTNVKDKAEALKRGKLSFGTTLNTSGGPTFPFDPNNPTGSLGASLAAKAAATTPSLIPSPQGKLTLGGSLSTSGSLKETFGDKDTFTPKAESKLGVGANYESKGSGRSAFTLGGLLGDKAKLTADVGGNLSGSVTPDKKSGELGAKVDLGLTGKRKGVETYVKLQLSGTVKLDQAGTGTTTTKTVFLGLTTGVKF